MQAAVTAKLRRETRREIIERLKQGVSVKFAQQESRVPMHRATIYRLLKRMQRFHLAQNLTESMEEILTRCRADRCKASVSSPEQQTDGEEQIPSGKQV
ncbi:MAG TPA: hypothetical protein VFV38_31155 [Ktedonobacteraceae bacterium]|nr:hypothetical protein [Ktedonobacteraceae bacterium]